MITRAFVRHRPALFTLIDAPGTKLSSLGKTALKVASFVALRGFQFLLLFNDIISKQRPSDPYRHERLDGINRFLVG